MVDHDDEAFKAEYGKQVGERLRLIRKQQKLSLQEVEATSKNEFKASVLGAYERGERSISVPRLHKLAQYYRVPVDQLLPYAPDESAPATDGEKPTSMKLDLEALVALEGPEADTLKRYVRMIQVQRQDFNGHVITIRRDDLRAIAAILGTNEDGAERRLSELGLRWASSPTA